MLRSRSKCVLALAVANVALMLSPGARVAQAESWIGPAPADGSVGGDWNTAAHWDLATVPNAIGASATINGSPVTTASTRNLPTSVATTLGSLTFNDNNTDTNFSAARATTVNADTGPSSCRVGRRGCVRAPRHLLPELRSDPDRFRYYKLRRRPGDCTAPGNRRPIDPSHQGPGIASDTL